MAVVSLELFKKHVRADDFSDDDIYLEHLLTTAETTVITATNRTFNELADNNHGKFPLPLQHAIMMLAAHWYNQRESVSTVHMSEVPYSIQALVNPYWRLADECRQEE